MAADNKNKILRDAEKYVLQGKTNQAITEYLKIVKSDPNDVLTLNTIGDLYLRQKKITEAINYFTQVAESYARNNFLLKAIAVYRKILNADPNNLFVNQTLASLYARHGSNVDARNQYLKVAEISVREGKNRESLEAYEKVAELDPMNAAVRLKLAEIQLAGGAKEKAHEYLAGAARAQVKAGHLTEAVSSFRRAMQLNPLDTALMRGFMETCVQLKNVAPALDQLKDSLALAPDNIDLLEMYGQACLAAGDTGAAAQTFQSVVAADGSRFGLFYEIHEAFLKAGDIDDAATCLDGIIPRAISRRNADRVMEAYKAILEIDSSHIPTLTRLAHLYSATNDQAGYLEALDRLADLHLKRQNPSEAVEYLDLILQIDPNSEKHLRLHREAYTEAFPGMPYVSPAKQESSAMERPQGPSRMDPELETAGAGTVPSDTPTMVEIDLLLNYGMYDKALELLRGMEARDPSAKEVRRKLIAVYEEQQQPTLAAEQCLILAALYRKAGEEADVDKLLAEANRLDEALVRARADQLLPPLKTSPAEGFPGKSAAALDSGTSPLEVDLSEDLSEIFFQGSSERGAPAEAEPPAVVSEETVEEYTSVAPPRMPEGSVTDQLQEVDFYIRLGFLEEARAKLDEISRDHPNHPELQSRYQQIDEGLSQPRSESPPARPSQAEQVQQAVESEVSIFGDLDAGLMKDTLPAEPAAESGSELEGQSALASVIDATPPPELEHVLEAHISAAPDLGKTGDDGVKSANDMFADLLHEVDSFTEKEDLRDVYETHFSLGIAYREMSLMDEAIKEFQEALRAISSSGQPREMIQCCGMLSTCFLEKGMAKSAIRWCEAGLGVPEISPHEALALRYDMGVAFSISGEAARALECFDYVYSTDPGYRDIAQKIDELRGGPGRNVP